MSGLIKSLKRNSRPDELAAEILRITDPIDGWVAKFSSYRDLFTHLAPMEQAAGTAFAVQDMRASTSGLLIPQIYYALPSDVQGLTRKRSKGTLYDTLEELSKASARKRERQLEPDALEYLHRCIDQFAVLSLSLADRSPIAAKSIEIGPADLIGHVRVS